MVSIVIPTYNRSHLLSRTLDGFLAQTINEWECIVVDDHSVDNTKEIVYKYSNRDDRFKYIVNTHTKGAQGARNTGIEHAQGEWIALFDSDDYAYPEYLEELTKHIKNNVDVVTSNAKMVDVKSNQCVEVLNWCAEGLILQKLLAGKIYVGYNCCIIKKQALYLIGLLDEVCPSMQEFDTHIRLSKEGCLYAATNRVLSDYYVGGHDTISINREKYVDGLSYVLKKHQFSWRKYAYKQFLLKMFEIWQCIKQISGNRIKYRIRVLLIAPELVVVKIIKYLKFKISSYVKFLHII